MPFHEEVVFPETAEQLMRSRYSAYFLRLVDYLVVTTHPSQLKPNYKQDLKSHIYETEWTNLEILKTSMGTPKDKIGKVEFIASYSMNNKPDNMKEYSRFKKFEGKWKYLDSLG